MTTSELPPMTEKVKAAIEHLKLENDSTDYKIAGYYRWAFAMMNAIDAIRESMQQPVADAPAPAAAPLRADREKVARAIGDAIKQMGLWHTPERAENLADAAISAMGADTVDVAAITAERDAARAELAELRKLVEGQKADANNFLLEVGRLENKHNKKDGAK